MRQGRVRHDDAAEGDDEGEENGDEEGGEEFVGGEGGDHLAEAEVIELEKDSEDVDGGGGVGVAGEARGEVPAAPWFASVNVPCFEDSG